MLLLPIMLLRKPYNGTGTVADLIGCMWVSINYRNGRICAVAVEHIYDDA